MWTRGRNKETGKFEVECTDWNGNVFFAGAFDTYQEADRAGEDAERHMTFKMINGDAPPLDGSTATMSDDELLAELMA